MTRQTALSGVSVTRHVKDTTANFDVVYQEQAYILTRQGRAWDMLHAKMRDERAVKQHEQGGEGGAFDFFAGRGNIALVAWRGFAESIGLMDRSTDIVGPFLIYTCSKRVIYVWYLCR